jgi:hypothetical protein
MVRKKNSLIVPAPYAGLRVAFDRIISSENTPPPEAFLDLGLELHKARLNYFIDGAIPGSSGPPLYVRVLAYAACRHHELTDEERARVKDDEHVKRVLAEMRPGLWPYVRDELVKFYRMVAEELKQRMPSTTGGGKADKRRRRGGKKSLEISITR